MILQPRDKRLLELLSRFGVLSTDQIAKLCFDKIAHTTVMRRIRKLEETNLVLRLGGLPNAMNAWCLTTEGATLIGKEEPFRYSNRNTLAHEVTLSELRTALDRVGLGADWTSEMEMRRRMQWRPSVRERNPLVPDGLFVASRSGQSRVVAVELELNAKNLARYRKLFFEYSIKNAMSLVWYVVATSSIGNTVLEQWNRTVRFQYSPVMIVTVLSEVLCDPATARVFTLDREKSRLSDWIDIKSIPNTDGGDGPQTAHEVSRQTPSEVSTGADSDPESMQRLASAPEIKRQVPPALDPSPATRVAREGSTPTGTKDEEGAEARNQCSESEAAA